MSRPGDRLYDRSEKKFELLAEPAHCAIYFDGCDEIPISKAYAEGLRDKGLARKEGRVIVRVRYLQRIKDHRIKDHELEFIEHESEQFEKCRVNLYLKSGITGKQYQTEISARSSNLSARMSPRVPQIKSNSSQKISNSEYMRLVESRNLNTKMECNHSDGSASFCSLCIMREWGTQRYPLQ